MGIGMMAAGAVLEALGKAGIEWAARWTWRRIQERRAAQLCQQKKDRSESNPKRAETEGAATTEKRQ